MTLHKINPPGCENKLRNILAFQRQVLQYACDPDTQLPLTREAIMSNFGVAGAWLCGRLWKPDRSKTDFHKDLEKLIAYLNNNPHKIPLILDAFNHDVTFDEHLDDQDYQFSYRMSLDNDDQKNLNPVMKAFYEDFLNSGYPVEIHGGTKKFDRDAFIEEFYSTNPDLEICPACDGPRSEKVDNKIFADADHYLPKSDYPFMSIHPVNLVPICLHCNRSFKLARDPIDDHIASPMSNAFFPYGRPAIDHISVQFERDIANGQHFVKIIDTDGLDRRVASLNRVFNLEKRWLDRVRQEIDIIRECVAEDGRKMRRRNVNLSRDDLRADLGDKLRERNNPVSPRRQYYLISSSYLSYALTNNDEFETLFEEHLRG